MELRSHFVISSVVLTLFLTILWGIPLAHAQTPPQRILILTMNHGSGHLIQAQAAEAAFQDISPSAVIEKIDLLDLQYMDPVSYFIWKPFHLWTLQHWPKFQEVSGARLTPRVMGLLLPRMFTSKAVEAIQDFQPDVIFCPHPLPPYLIAWMMKKGKLPNTIPVISLMTDYGYLPGYGVPFDVMTPSRVAQERLLAAGKPAKNIHVIPSLPVLPPFIPEQTSPKFWRQQLGLHPDYPVILVSGGGDGIFLNGFVSFLKHWHPTQPIQVILVTGKNKQLYHRVNRLRRRLDPNVLLVLEGYTTKMPKYWYAADLHISKLGGATVAESIASRTPIFVHHVGPAQERENVEYFKDQKLVAVIHSFNLLQDMRTTLRIAATLRARLNRAFPNAAEINRQFRDTLKRLACKTSSQ